MKGNSVNHSDSDALDKSVVGEADTSWKRWRRRSWDSTWCRGCWSGGSWSGSSLNRNLVFVDLRVVQTSGDKIKDSFLENIVVGFVVGAVVGGKLLAGGVKTVELRRSEVSNTLDIVGVVEDDHGLSDRGRIHNNLDRLLWKLLGLLFLLVLGRHDGKRGSLVIVIVRKREKEETKGLFMREGRKSFVRTQ